MMLQVRTVATFRGGTSIVVTKVCTLCEKSLTYKLTINALLWMIVIPQIKVKQQPPPELISIHILEKVILILSMQNLAKHFTQANSIHGQQFIFFPSSAALSLNSEENIECNDRFY